MGHLFELYNPEKQIALPTFIMSGKKIVIEITSGTNVTVLEFEDDVIVNNITIDSETQDCYNETRMLNNKVKRKNNKWIFKIISLV